MRLWPRLWNPAAIPGKPALDAFIGGAPDYLELHQRHLQYRAAVFRGQGSARRLFYQCADEQPDSNPLLRGRGGADL